jgi:hypothetical protein
MIRIAADDVKNAGDWANFATIYKVASAKRPAKAAMYLPTDRSVEIVLVSASSFTVAFGVCVCPGGLPCCGPGGI